MLIGGAATAGMLAVGGIAALRWRNRPRSPILWSYEVPDFLGDGPMLAGNTVFVTGQETFALDPRDGRVRWRSSDKIDRSSLPVVQDGKVFIYDGGSINALGLTTGDTAWTEALKTFEKAPVPIVTNGLAVMTASLEPGDYVLYAFDAATGQDRWRYQLEELVDTGAAAANGVFYVASGRELLYAVDATGRLRWQQPMGGKSVSTPAVAGGLVIVVIEGYQVLAFDVTTGKPRWRNTSGATSGGAVASDPVPIIVAGTVYIRGSGGVLHALDAATGRERWSFSVGSKAGPPTITNGFLFVHDGKGTLYALDAATGKARWTHHFDTAPGAQPALMNNTLYAGATDGVFGFDPPTGRITFRLDKTDFPAELWVYVETLVPWGGVLYCAMGSDKLLALRTT